MNVERQKHCPHAFGKVSACSTQARSLRFLHYIFKRSLLISVNMSHNRTPLIAWALLKRPRFSATSLRVLSCLNNNNSQHAAFGTTPQNLNNTNRFFSTGKINFLKEIRYTETEKEIVIEGVDVKSPREGQLIKLPDENHACSLCKLDLKNLSHTDVLIIGQFLQKDGSIVPQSITGLCKKQHMRVKALIRKAQRAGLLPPRIDDPPAEPWDRFNTYFKR